MTAIVTPQKLATEITTQEVTQETTEELTTTEAITEPAPLQLTDSPQAFLLLPREAYDALDAWNASLIKVVHKKTPAHAWHQFRDPDAEPQADTQAFRIGRMTHAAILEPDLFEAEFVTIPEDAPKRPTEKQLQDGADAKPGTKARATYEDAHQRLAWWQAFDAKAAGADIVPAGEYQKAQALVAAVEQHPGLQPILLDPEMRCLNEVTLTWFDPVSGDRLKARIDAIRFNGNAIKVFELKSAEDASPEAFGKAVVSYDYLISAAFYYDAVEACLPAIAQALGLDERVLVGRPIEFEYTVMEKGEPFLIGRYDITPDQLQIGRDFYQAALAKVVSASQMGYWPGYDMGPVPLELPYWFERRLEVAG
jgi:hypothetical protein